MSSTAYATHQPANLLPPPPPPPTADSRTLLRAFFAEYTRFHARSMRSLGPDTKFLIVHARPYKVQGMGNRLLALVSGFLLAALTERVLIVDWSRNPDDGFAIDDLFDEPPINWRVSELERQLWPAGRRRHAIYDTTTVISVLEHWEMSSAEYERLACSNLSMWSGRGSPQFLTLDSNQFFAPLLWHNSHLRARLESWGLSNGQLGVWVFRYLFHPVSAVRQYMDEIKAQHWRPYMIGVQLRTKDGHETNDDITKLNYRWRHAAH